MLGYTSTIHPGIQWPRIRCSRAYAEHQHGRLQGLCPILPIIFSCVPELIAQHKSRCSCALELLDQYKSSITQVIQSFPLNTNHRPLKCSRASRSTQIINHSSAPELPAQHKTSHQSCASRSTSNTKKNIYISTIIGLRLIYKTNHHVHVYLGFSTQYKIKHQDNHHN